MSGGADVGVCRPCVSEIADRQRLFAIGGKGDGCAEHTDCVDAIRRGK